MRYLRITGEPDLEIVPDAFRIITASEHVREARLEAFNIGGSAVHFLYRIDGSTGHLLLRLDPAETAIGEHLFGLLEDSGLLVLTPAVYREGTVQAAFVGENAAIQAVMDHLPPAFDVVVEELTGSVPRQETAADRLSERQREAVRAALDLGYYDQPRRATHGDVAERLGCAPSTASEHLRKAEAALVRAAIDHG
ncbi:hypothetical protein BRD19_01170 [Halobacteriales archaeon SW_7_65_23]|nr:MAG: hypothetical protein BRD19_01170 [Halobacteriales archaeon SW_7_65_23]